MDGEPRARRLELSGRGPFTSDGMGRRAAAFTCRGWTAAELISRSETISCSAVIRGCMIIFDGERWQGAPWSAASRVKVTVGSGILIGAGGDR